LPLQLLSRGLRRRASLLSSLKPAGYGTKGRYCTCALVPCGFQGPGHGWMDGLDGLQLFVPWMLWSLDAWVAPELAARTRFAAGPMQRQRRALFVWYEAVCGMYAQPPPGTRLVGAAAEEDPRRAPSTALGTLFVRRVLTGCRCRPRAAKRAGQNGHSSSCVSSLPVDRLAAGEGGEGGDERRGGGPGR